VGIDRTTVNKDEKKNISNVMNHNTCIPTQNYEDIPIDAFFSGFPLSLKQPESQRYYY